jgi:hypothetical protein
MKLFLTCLGGAAALALVLGFVMSRLRYHVGRSHVKILLFGIPIRRISILNIAYASKREPDGFAEKWYNTFKTSHRLLTIEKIRGFPKYFCITPKNRYVVMTEIKNAVRKLDPDADWARVKPFEPLPGA